VKFSLILATVGRVQELEEFLNSLTKQRDIDLELVIVDQNSDDRLVPILANYQSLFPILRLRSEKGLSKARNVGLKQVTGNIIAFPDDDCEYPIGILDYVREKFEQDHHLDGLTGRTVTHTGETSVGKFDLVVGRVDKRNVWLRGVSITVFLNSKIASGIFFDETLGAGAKWGSGEETDFLLQALSKGANIIYDPNLKIIHPPPPTIYTPQLVQKEYTYGLGMGRVLQKHSYPLWFKAKMLIRPLGGSIVALWTFNIFKVKGYWYRFIGRWQGLISK
jgi:glycosyltransferase involved in cell wall biosynthesis